jgi:hypothetical protein
MPIDRKAYTHARLEKVGVNLQVDLEKLTY